ncbi:MAG: 1,4-alpha-glucan branching protein GlgB [Microbacteriaceae bacterium]|nr:1,4-alpha-glucan branching protein GlgB [Microbacteriaceae bacterium]
MNARHAQPAPGAPRTHGLGAVDLHLIGEGRHEQLWNALGAHPGALDGVDGTWFAVWAPNASEVRLAGERWSWVPVDGPALTAIGSGVWEAFVPGIGPGDTYKFAIRGAGGDWSLHIDPLARWTQTPPDTASRVVASGYAWGDEDWLARRAGSDPHTAPMSVYELHLGSWKPGLDYRQVAAELVPYVQELGFTHVEFLPVMEHPYGPSWGYQVTGYYAPTSRFGHPDDFRHLVDALHQAGIGVILDWVPAHFPKDDWALARYDGAPLYEHADPFLGDHPDWGTYIFDFGRSEVRNFLVANALYWLEEFHVDGLRVDAVASMLYLDYSRKPGEWRPNVHGGREHLEAIAFLQEVTATAYKRNPGIVMIAEESTAWPGVTSPTSAGGLGFGLKWNMGWMHDSLQYMEEQPIHRSFHHDEMTFSMLYAYSERYLLPLSHDEVVHGKGSLLEKMPGSRPEQHAQLRAYLAWQWAHPGKQLLFMGGEFAQSSEWSQERGLEWWLTEHREHAGTQHLVHELNRHYRERGALWELDHDPAGFAWIDERDAAQNVIAFLRWSRGGHAVAAAFNFSGVAVDYRIALPSGGRWNEILNTDAVEFGGNGTGNLGGVDANAGEHYGRPASAWVHLPALSAVWLAP